VILGFPVLTTNQSISSFLFWEDISIKEQAHDNE